MALPSSITTRLRLPVVAAPMLTVSGPELVIAACQNGVIGAFPTANARTVDGLDGWLKQIKQALVDFVERNPGRPPAPFCPNLIIRRADMAEQMRCLVRHKVEMVITSVGSPTAVIAPLHEVGALVLADVATLHHAEKAIAAGADGLILLTAGAGGQTGWLNPFAFVRAVREIFAGLIVLAGGITDGHALWTARVLGCDLAYMGTKFIATHESLAPDRYKEMLVANNMDDVLLTRAFTGLDTNMLRPSIVAAGLDPAKLPNQVSAEFADAVHGGGTAEPGPRRWRDIWSAGHSIAGVTKIQSVAELIEQTRQEYAAARQSMSSLAD